MKEILYNYDFLEEKQINNFILRSKIIIINSKEEILIGKGNNTYQLIGGHVEENETFDQCIVREIKEETGIDIPYEKRKPFLVIKYMCKDYPTLGQNTKYINNYYVIKSDLRPDYSKINLTENEKEGMFELKYIHKDKIIDELNKNLDICHKKNVVKDTLEVISEYIENHMN